MPLQNVGTLIENLVVAQAASILLCHTSGKDLGMASAFAMPAFSEWRPHPQNVGITDLALNQIADAEGRSDFVAVMAACLRRSRTRGPNAALLVALTTRRHRTGFRAWVNDIREGHYGDAMPSLRDLKTAADNVCSLIRSTLEIVTCDQPYPLSISNAASTLQAWGDELGGVLAFLDPMRYTLTRTEGPYTSSTDHRQWLAAVKGARPTLVVQFTGNSDSKSLESETAALREDLTASGFGSWLEVRRQHYVVSVGANEAALLGALERSVRSAWGEWCDHVPEIVTRDLRILRGGLDAG
jgi:hypothetical protein